jgi:two-component system, response regulator
MTASPIEILLIEDNPNDVALALRAFKKHNLTQHVHVIRDGAEALEYVLCTGAYAQRDVAHAPKVILLDLKLPFVDGIEVLRHIKGNPHTRHYPVVVLTSSREERDVLETYQLGVNSYIVKPVNFEQFIEFMGTLGTYWLMLNQPLTMTG